MLSNLKKYLFILFFGISVGCISTIYIDSKFFHHKEDSSQIGVKTISGDPLLINGISYKDKATTIDTSYLGKGQSIISIPNSSNPSANAWDNYHWGVGGMVSTNLTYHALVLYRYERIMCIGDVWFKNRNEYEFGLSFGAMYILSL